MTRRTLLRTIESVATADGAGVRLRRSLGSIPGLDTDPFLMLDEFSSDDPDDYIAGFPSHPHRGFETVTYMLDGRMLHEDHMGHHSTIGPGDVQWMTAGRGVIHSEMPRQDRGRMRGFQLWINLPAAEKMKPAGYRDVASDEIPFVDLGDGARGRLIAGAIGGTRGPINEDDSMATDPLYLDLRLDPGGRASVPVPAGLRLVVYVFEGRARFGPEGEAGLAAGRAGLFSDEGDLAVSAGDRGARMLVLAGRPLREPVVQYGPFVMNRREEIEQAIRDYQQGRLTA